MDGLCSLSMALGSILSAAPAILPLPIADFIATLSTTMTTPRDVIKAYATKACKDNYDKESGGIQRHDNNDNNGNNGNERRAATA